MMVGADVMSWAWKTEYQCLAETSSAERFLIYLEFSKSYKWFDRLMPLKDEISGGCVESKHYKYGRAGTVNAWRLESGRGRG